MKNKLVYFSALLAFSSSALAEFDDSYILLPEQKKAIAEQQEREQQQAQAKAQREARYRPGNQFILGVQGVNDDDAQLSANDTPHASQNVSGLFEIYAGYEHDIFLLPSIRAHYLEFDYKGQNSAENQPSELFLANGYTTLKLYYHLLRTDHIRFDLGVANTSYAGKANGKGPNFSGNIYQKLWSPYAAMYLRIPHTTLQLYAEGHGSGGDNEVTDISAGVRFSLYSKSHTGARFTASLGYRQFNTDFRDLRGGGGTYMDSLSFDIDGMFAGIELAF
ncbi:hypothetical protein [Ferrimonas pelagia]|uniref:Outer membrane beta-barrel domain-containing protein n=1 Tax=Ferrimonas pelagia TaxID=1177826 RepID=A0ABP9EU76_9GAMM